MTAIDRAITKVGSQVALALLLGVTKQAVNQWINNKRPVPPEKCPMIELHCGVRCEDLRPDIDWNRSKNGRVIGYHTSIVVPIKPKAKAA